MIACSGQVPRAQPALHAVLLDEAQLRQLRVVQQRARRAGAHAAHAQRALVDVDGHGAERRAGRQRDAFAAAPVPARPGGRARVPASRACRPRRQTAPAAAAPRRPAAASSCRSWSRSVGLAALQQAEVAAGIAQAFEQRLRHLHLRLQRLEVLRRLLAGGQHRDVGRALAPPPSATARCRCWRHATAAAESRGPAHLRPRRRARRARAPPPACGRAPASAAAGWAHGRPPSRRWPAACGSSRPGRWPAGRRR